MSRTRLLKVDPEALTSPESQGSLATAARLLRDGGTVAFPTETVYGLGANALNAAAVQAIFAAKQRPAWDPLIVHIADRAMLEALTGTPTELEQVLMEAFWPGALTLLLPRSPAVPDAVTAGRERVGVRMPAHPVAQAVIQQAGVPVAAPSANAFGHTSPTTAQHVLDDLDGRIDAVIDGGATTLGLESTVLDARAQPPVLYRPGMITLERLREIVPDVVRYVSTTTGEAARAESLPSPGVGIRHYAPRARLVLVDAERFADALCDTKAGDGVLLADPWIEPAGAGVRVYRWGSWSDPEELAQRLFAGLRELDAQGVERILCPRPAPDGVGAALRDRLEKAAMPGS